MKKEKRSTLSLIIALFLLLIVTASLATLFFSVPLFISSANKKAAMPTGTLLIPKFSLSSFISKKDQETTILAVGDIMLGRYCNVQMLKQKDFRYLFSNTANFTSSADITFGNLEAPFLENCPSNSEGMVFCARPEAIEGLAFGGFNLLSIANNHILNHGQEGLEQTKNFLIKNKIQFSDPNEITTKQVNNVNYGFLSFDLVTDPNAPVLERVKENISKVDVLLVSLHWGAEYQKEPSAQQKKLAHELLDAGVKIIFGHHPHVVQPMETYGNGLIFYSLGNFIFDQPWSEATKQGQIAKIIFEGEKIKSYEAIPFYIKDYCQPELTQ